LEIQAALQVSRGAADISRMGRSSVLYALLVVAVEVVWIGCLVYGIFRVASL